MRALLLLLIITGCSLPEDRYWELREGQECRIFGPDCAGDYESIEDCLGDESVGSFNNADGDYDAQSARDCIRALEELCPSRGLDFDVPKVCSEVYSAEY